MFVIGLALALIGAVVGIIASRDRPHAWGIRLLLLGLVLLVVPST
jgi:hypothetical protein